MSEAQEPNELSTKSTKDLRQLAGEHNIHNRSKLGRDDLIEALAQVIANRVESGDPVSASEPPAARAMAASAGAEPEVIDAASVAFLSPAPAQPAEAAESDDEDDDDEDDDGEPDVLDAASLAGGEGQPGQPGERRRRRRRRRRRGGRAQLDENGQPIPPAPGAPGVTSDGTAPAADGAAPVPSAEGVVPAISEARPDQRREPRDQREGGREPRDGNRDQREGGREPRDGNREPRDGNREPRDQRDGREPRDGNREPRDQREAGREPRDGNREPRDQREGGREPRDQRDGNRDPNRDPNRDSNRDPNREPRDPNREPRDGGRPPRDGNRETRDGREPRNDGRDQRGRPPEGAQPNRAPRPRLDGPQRPMPSVLERLCTFSRGILELCDPSTPSWAQARLSELLAEAGLAPVPVSGPAHPEFHDVVGTVVTTAVPAGHIAVVEAPGFALRGDRGDLFPLRKARVKIAPGVERPQPTITPPPVVPASEPEVLGPDTSFVAASPVAEPQPVAAQPDVVAEAASPVTPTPGDDQPGATEIAAVPEDAADFSHPARTVTQTEAGDQGGGRRDQGGRHERGGRDRGGRGDSRRREDDDAPREAHYSRVTPASAAPPLPLVSQDADELALRPKAEGFRELGLNDQILADLAAMGYSTPTPIQAEAIPTVLAGKDMIGQAQTGTGKTAAFVLPLLQKLYQHEGPGPVGLVLCPTRELARQVYNEFVKMAGASAARAAIIYGGVSMDDQFDALNKHPHVVVGTPGRIIDHMKRKTLDLSRLTTVILDEADQMLDIGFWPDVMWIMSHTPPARQTLLFSATFPDPIKAMAEKHMRDPAHVRIRPAQITVEQVDQKFIAVAHDKKTSLLAHFIETQNPEQLVVFCRTKHQTDRVAEVLKRKNLSAGAIHGDLPQGKRERMLQQFRNRELQCLIATNVAARGLDIPTVSHVVNYDIPENPEEYVHRIGRTARNGAKGVARTFITPEDGQFLLEIEKHIGLLLEEELIEGFMTHGKEPEAKRPIADTPVGGAPRLLKPLIGGIRLGRRRR